MGGIPTADVEEFVSPSTVSVSTGAAGNRAPVSVGARRAATASGGATIGVLALQGDVAEHVRAIGAAGGRPVPVRRAAELDAVDGLIIPGGESTTIWKLLDIFELAAPLRARI